MMDVPVNKVFDATDALDSWYAILDRVGAEGDRQRAPVAGGQMRRWEYAWLLSQAAPTPGMRAIDIGCDKTMFPVVLRMDGQCESYAVDMNFDENTENWFRGAGVNPWRCDALRLPYPDNFFDRVYSVCVGEHIGDTSMRGWYWRTWQEKLLSGCGMFLKECVRVLKRGGITAHTFDFAFPELGSRPCGFDPEMAAAFLPTVCGASPVGAADFSLKSVERSIPECVRDNLATAHTTVAMIWRKH